MTLRIKAIKNPEGDCPQDVRVRVASSGVPGDWHRPSVGVGDVVFVDDVAACPKGSVGTVAAFGADGLGYLIVKVELYKREFYDWPTNEFWAYPDQLHRAFHPMVTK